MNVPTIDYASWQAASPGGNAGDECPLPHLRLPTAPGLPRRAHTSGYTRVGLSQTTPDFTVQVQVAIGRAWLAVRASNTTQIDAMSASLEMTLVGLPQSLTGPLRAELDLVRSVALLLGNCAPEALTVVTRSGDSSNPAPTTSDCPLSPRERSVLRLIGDGFSNKRIARELAIAPETVKSHAKHILDKLNAQTRAEAVARAVGLCLT